MSEYAKCPRSNCNEQRRNVVVTVRAVGVFSQNFGLYKYVCVVFSSVSKLPQALLGLQMDI